MMFIDRLTICLFDNLGFFHLACLGSQGYCCIYSRQLKNINDICLKSIKMNPRQGPREAVKPQKWVSKGPCLFVVDGIILCTSKTLHLDRNTLLDTAKNNFWMNILFSLCKKTEFGKSVGFMDNETLNGKIKHKNR